MSHGLLVNEYDLFPSRVSCFVLDASLASLEIKSLRLDTTTTNPRYDDMMSLFESTDPDTLAWGDHKRVVSSGGADPTIEDHPTNPAEPLAYDFVATGDCTETSRAKSVYRWKYEITGAIEPAPAWREHDGDSIFVHWAVQTETFDQDLEDCSWNSAVISEANTNIEIACAVDDETVFSSTLTFAPSGNGEELTLLAALLFPHFDVSALFSTDGTNYSDAGDYDNIEDGPPAAGDSPQYFFPGHKFQRFYTEDRHGVVQRDLRLSFALTGAIDAPPWEITWTERTRNINNGSITDESPNSVVSDGSGVFSDVDCTVPATGHRIFFFNFNSANLSRSTLPLVIPSQEQLT